MPNPDSERISPWMATTPSAPAFPPLEGDVGVDVAVVGAGIVGVATALALVRAGKHVALIEADRICSGVTGSTTGKVTSLHGLVYTRLARKHGHEAARDHARSHQAAIEQVDEWCRELGIDCAFERLPAITYTLMESEMKGIEAEVHAAREAGLDAELVRDLPELPFRVAGAVRLANQAQFHAREFCLGLVRALVEKGGIVHESTRATAIHTGSPCVVETARGRVQADHVVVATHLPILDRGGFFAKTSPKGSHGLAVRLDGRAPEGMYIDTSDAVRSLRPGRDRSVLIVVGETHKVGHGGDPRLREAALEAWTRAHFPVREVEYRWFAHDYMSVDGLPYIGRMPRSSDKLLVATGFGKWGLSTGIVAASILTDRILGRDNPYAGLYDATRIEIAAGAVEFAKANLDVAKRFVGDRLGHLAAPEAAKFMPGEGGLAKHEGKLVAAYRDEDGALHVLSPSCTHMGCRVAWNAADKTWDCPCHGSRFAHDGAVLHGPATEALESTGERMPRGHGSRVAREP